ncbi:MAG: hypothetical protein PVG65_04640 [Candidatus Thorarchaeota archaeon]|jgi:hypothetical protein
MAQKLDDSELVSFKELLMANSNEVDRNAHVPSGLRIYRVMRTRL